jgi:hypothetical protein
MFSKLIVLALAASPLVAAHGKIAVVVRSQPSSLVSISLTS